MHVHGLTYFRRKKNKSNKRPFQLIVDIDNSTYFTAKLVQMVSGLTHRWQHQRKPHKTHWFDHFSLFSIAKLVLCPRKQPNSTSFIEIFIDFLPKRCISSIEVCFCRMSNWRFNINPFSVSFKRTHLPFFRRPMNSLRCDVFLV